MSEPWIDSFRRHRLALCLVLAFAFSMVVPVTRAEAACTVPNQIANGQVADATAIMDNFNALNNCADSAVTPFGTPAAGNLPVFSGPKSITSGNLAGDCTTAGALSVTCTKTSGVPYGYFATGTDAAQLTGTVSVNRFNGGVNADSAHFLRGDGLWAAPPTGGGGTGPTSGTPLIRSSNIQSFNANSVTISWPTGTVAGDVVFIFVSDGYAVNSPAGWAILNNSGANDWANGLTAAKVMTASDITAGGITVSITGAYVGVASAVTIDGTTFNGVREVAAARSAGSASRASASLSGLLSSQDSDTIIGFTYVRGAMNPSISDFSQLQLVNAANGSAFLAKFSATPGKLGLIETATYPSTNNGYYWSAIALR